MAFKRRLMTEQEALERLMAQCSQAEHSSGEAREKMRRWQLPDDVQTRILERLIDGRYIDDERFCRAFVYDKVHFDRWGRRKIEAALYQKGVDKGISARALDDVDDEEYIGQLRQLVAAKRQNTLAGSEYEMNGKLIKYALGRGFTYDVIRKCIGPADEYGMEADED